MVANADAVTAYFGYWPEFADGRIVAFALDATGTISLGIAYSDTKLGRSGTVHLRFTGVSDAELNELRRVNVLDALHVSDGLGIEVRLEAVYGLTGSFRCEAATVVGFEGEAQ